MFISNHIPTSDKIVKYCRATTILTLVSSYSPHLSLHHTTNTLDVIGKGTKNC